MFKHPNFPGTATADAPEEELEDLGARGGGFLGCWVMWMDCRVLSFTMWHLCHRRRKSSPLIISLILNTLNFYFEGSLQLHIYKECLPLLAQKQHHPALPPLVPIFKKCHPWDSLVSTRSLANIFPHTQRLKPTKRDCQVWSAELPSLLAPLSPGGSSGVLGISFPRHIQVCYSPVLGYPGGLALLTLAGTPLVPRGDLQRFRSEWLVTSSSCLRVLGQGPSTALCTCDSGRQGSRLRFPSITVVMGTVLPYTIRR